jgi:hypothetical protein
MAVPTKYIFGAFPGVFVSVYYTLVVRRTLYCSILCFAGNACLEVLYYVLLGMLALRFSSPSSFPPHIHFRFIESFNLVYQSRPV